MPAAQFLAENLRADLREKFMSHWYENDPLRGQAYRCLRGMLESCDPLLQQALTQSFTSSDTSHFSQCLSVLTIWIDPNDVSYRIEGGRNNIRSIARRVRSGQWISYPVDLDVLIGETDTVRRIHNQSSTTDVCRDVRLMNKREDRVSSFHSATKRDEVALAISSSLCHPVDRRNGSICSSTESLSSNSSSISPVASPPPTTHHREPTQQHQQQSKRRNSRSGVSNNSNNNNNNNNNNKPTVGYCGYVESYPHHYKKYLYQQRFISMIFEHQSAYMAAAAASIAAASRTATIHPQQQPITPSLPLQAPQQQHPPTAIAAIDPAIIAAAAAQMGSSNSTTSSNAFKHSLIGQRSSRIKNRTRRSVADRAQI
ncbi:hypothetical protein ACOME3_000901 [Neoechinorhynchus agilis]